MADETPQTEQKEFDPAYVKQLRDENANWRRKTRDLEAQVFTDQVALEFVKRGVQAEPSWLKPMEGQSVPDAVEDFVGRYPHLVIQTTPTQPSPQAPNVQPFGMPPMPPQISNTNVPGPGPSNGLINRDFESIKKDPQARKELTELYRDLLAQNSHRNRE